MPAIMSLGTKRPNARLHTILLKAVTTAPANILPSLVAISCFDGLELKDRYGVRRDALNDGTARSPATSIATMRCHTRLHRM